MAGRARRVNEKAGSSQLAAEHRHRRAEDIAQLICAVLEQEALTGQIITEDSGQTL